MAARFFHVEALVDEASLHDALSAFDELQVFNVQVRAVRPNNRLKVTAPHQSMLPPPSEARKPGARGGVGHTLYDKVLEVLGRNRGAMSIEDIWKAMPGYPRGSLAQGMYILKTRGKVTRVGPAIYALSTPTPEKSEAKK